jgi:hypothetical protein
LAAALEMKAGAAMMLVAVAVLFFLTEGRTGRIQCFGKSGPVYEASGIETATAIATEAAVVNYSAVTWADSVPSPLH